VSKIVGVISDTHGLLRPEVPRIFKGVDLILHAGDIGGPEVLDELRRLAPTIAVRGNNDKGDWADGIPEENLTHVEAVAVFMLHDLKQLRLPASTMRHPVQAVISGHSHRPSIEHREGILFLNPGSAGPRRFKLPVSLARLTIQKSTVSAELLKIA
jgi:putative phosphoesterase